jgi:uncharacterized protein YecE (DUF72 family)
MSFEGLAAILNKEEVVVTRQARDFIECPKAVDDAYRWHVSTYIPMHRGIAAEGQLDVATFARRLIQRGRERKPALGYLTADFGYGKTSAGLYLWQQATEAGFVTVPPFQMNRLPDLLDATYGWVRYILSRNKPHLITDAEQIYHRYTSQSLAQMSAQSGASDEVLKKWISNGILSLDLPPDRLGSFFQEMTELVLSAGFSGLLVLPDELQQYLEPRIKSGLTDPIAPLFNLVQMLAAQNDLPFGLLLIIPQKELNVISDQRSDFIDRIRGLTLDLRAIYSREFPAQLWAKLADVFSFEPLAGEIFQPETLEALGQISIRDDLSNGPRTVINAFRVVSRRYLEHDLPQPYSPINLIDDFINGTIVFDGVKRIQDSVGQALASNLVRNHPRLVSAVKLAAAFPVEGCSIDLQRRYQAKDAFDELITSGLNELVISVGDRREGGITLRGLEVMRDESDWLTKTIRDFHRNYYEEAANTLQRAARGFVAVLRDDIFKSNDWKLLQEQPASEMQHASLTLEGAFNNIARRFPNRLVHIRVVSENEPLKDIPSVGEVTLEFRIKRHFEVVASDQGQLLKALTLSESQTTAIFTLNLLYQSDMPLPHRLETILGRVVPESKITPMFLLALHDHLETLQASKLIPKIEAQLIMYEFQPELRRVALDELLNATVGAQFGSVGARIVEDVMAHLLQARYGDDYHTLMTVANWSNNLRKYNAALRQLRTSLERQGHTPVRGDKDRIASYFGLANTGLDNYLANMADLLEVVEKFPTKHRSDAGAKGAVRFRQHPLEIEIQDSLGNSANTIQRDGQSLPALPLAEINRHATSLGYKEAEIEHIVALLEARELVHSQAGQLALLPQISFSRGEITDRIEQFQQETQLIQHLFPRAAGLSKLAEKADSYAKQIKRLPPQPDETVFNLLADLDEQTDWLLETKYGCLDNLHQQIIAQGNQLPRSSTQHETLLEQIVGTSVYLVELNNIRLKLLKVHQQLAADLHNLAQSLAQPPTMAEIRGLPAEQLVQLVQSVEQREQNLVEGRKRLQELDSQVAYLKVWIDMAGQSATLLNRLQQNGPPARELLQAFRAAEAETATAFAQQLEQQLSQTQTHQQQLTEIERRLAQLEAQANTTFALFQNAYQQAIVQRLGVSRADLWPQIIYSPLNPEGVRAQVYEAVQRIIVGVLTELDQNTRGLANNLRNVTTSPALQFLDATMRERLATQATELEVQLANLYDPKELEEYAQDLNIIRDFQPTDGGNFYTFLRQIAAAQQTLRDYRRLFNSLQEPLQRLALSPIEAELIKSLSQLQQQAQSTSDLIEVREKLSQVDDTVFWEAVRSLWEKQLVYLRVESKSPRP